MEYQAFQQEDFSAFFEAALYFLGSPNCILQSGRHYYLEALYRNFLLLFFSELQTELLGPGQERSDLKGTAIVYRSMTCKKYLSAGCNLNNE